MSETSIQTAMRQKEQQARKAGGMAGPYNGRIYNVNPQSERANVDFYAGAKSGKGINVLHPYLGINSWIRVMPDEGTGVLLHNRADSKDPEIERYYMPDTSKRVNAYSKAIEPYRTIQPGEIEISSKGLAQIFFARRGVLDIRAGAIRQWLDEDKTEYGVRSPTHKSAGYQNVSDQIGDEERWGVVKRPISSIYEKYVKVNNNFAKEHMDVLLFEGVPNILYDKREGHVVNNSGTQIKSNLTGNNLRLRHIYYTVNEEAVIKEIDELGNVTLTLPSNDATDGLTVIVPAGNIRLQSEKDFSRVINGSESVSIAKDHTETISGKETVEVEKNAVHKYSGNLKIAVTNNRTEFTDSNGNGMVWTSSGVFFKDCNGNITSLANLIGHTHIGNLGLPTSPASGSVLVTAVGATTPFIMPAIL
jgi:hypothetical protein